MKPAALAELTRLRAAVAAANSLDGTLSAVYGGPESPDLDADAQQARRAFREAYDALRAGERG